MKEYKTPLGSFIGGWFIDRKFCEDLINFFENNKKRQFKGLIGGAVSLQVNDRVKKSIDISMSGHDSIFDNYNNQLQKCIDLYMMKYPEVRKHYATFYSTIENYNIQKYKPGDGFYDWHCERNSRSVSRRCLVWMTYLNDVTEGGTEFKYQNLKTDAKCGLTLIWPTDFTHMHRGVISQNETKYIITGSYAFE